MEDMPLNLAVQVTGSMLLMCIVYFVGFYALLPMLIRKQRHQTEALRIWRNLPGAWLIFTGLFGWLAGSLIAFQSVEGVELTPFMAGILLLCLYQGGKASFKIAGAVEVPTQE